MEAMAAHSMAHDNLRQCKVSSGDSAAAAVQGGRSAHGFHM